MSLIIDGYNLLNAVGIMAGGVGPHTLQRARAALLNFLAESLEPKERARTTIVFDAAGAPPGLPRADRHHDMLVRFSVGYQEADDLIEELIRVDSAPRRLTVVSSDHRLQRAAHRRRAAAVDSDVWYADVVRRRHARKRSQKASRAEPAKPAMPLSAAEVEVWLARFGGEQSLAELIEAETRADTCPAEHVAPPARSSETHPDKPTDAQAAGLANPFPPGYAEDLLEDEADEEGRIPFPPHDQAGTG